jgi:hypothetical protein
MLRIHPPCLFQHINGKCVQLYRCPLLYPAWTGQTCNHEQFRKHKACVKDIKLEAGGLMRVTLELRWAPLSGKVPPTRLCERINSQAQSLGIERPKVRNGRSVANLNTLM